MTEAEAKLIEEALQVYVGAKTEGEGDLTHVPGFEEAARAVRRERFGRDWPGWDSELRQLARHRYEAMAAFRKMKAAVIQSGLMTQDELDELVDTWRKEDFPESTPPMKLKSITFVPGTE